MNPSSPSEPAVLERAVLRTVAYSDVFDFAPRLGEVHRYLDGVEATEDDVERAVAALVPDRLTLEGETVVLAGREDLFELGRRRRETARRLWPAATRWGLVVGRLPFARMVALTGALAVDNADPGADLDYLVVTEPGRVWLCRWMVIQVVRLARLRGVVICPNWVLAADALVLPREDLFVARNLTQMVPLAGTAIYDRMRELNPWTRTYLPNSGGTPRRVGRADRRPGRLARAGEVLLGAGLGSSVEGWERRRKTREILAGCGEHPEVVLDHRQCKGHVDAHGRAVLRAYAERLSALGLEAGPCDGASGSR